MTILPRVRAATRGAAKQDDQFALPLCAAPSRSVSRLQPTTSAARMVARRHSSVGVVAAALVL